MVASNSLHNIASLPVAKHNSSAFGQVTINHLYCRRTEEQTEQQTGDADQADDTDAVVRIRATGPRPGRPVWILFPITAVSFVPSLALPLW